MNVLTSGYELNNLNTSELSFGKTLLVVLSLATPSLYDGSDMSSTAVVFNQYSGIPLTTVTLHVG